MVLRLLKTPNMSRFGDRAEALPGSRHREVKACRSHKSLGVNVDRSFSASPTWGAAQPFLLGERSNHVATPGDATRYGRDTNLMIDTFDESPVCVCGGLSQKVTYSLIPFREQSQNGKITVMETVVVGGCRGRCGMKSHVGTWWRQESSTF